MFIDMHVHEWSFSRDSKMPLKDIVARAREMGMGGICITDHDSLGIMAEAERYSREIGFPIFVGVEILTIQGDIIAFGSPYAFQPRTIDAQEFINYVHSNGGACFSAHPLRNNNRGLEEHLGTVKMLDGVEVLNGSTDMEANRKALDYSRRYGIQPVGCSDAHKLEKLGCYATWLPEDPKDLESFIRVLRSGKCRPAVWEADHFRIVEEF